MLTSFGGKCLTRLPALNWHDSSQRWHCSPANWIPRLILDESGGWASGAHFYRPHSKEREKLSELHSYVRAPVSQKHWQLYQNLGKQNTTEGNTQIEPALQSSCPNLVMEDFRKLRLISSFFQANPSNPKLPAYRHHQKLLTDIQQALQAVISYYVTPM